MTRDERQKKMAYPWFDPPEVVIPSKALLKWKQTCIPSTHVVVALQPSLAHTNTAHELAANIESCLINPIRDTPVISGYFFKVAG
jgi:hypothetical protein